MPQFCYHLETPDGTAFPVETPRCLIGRGADCDVRLPSPEISRRHAVILRDHHDFWLADAGSSGGTWLNDTRLTRAAKLHTGDFIGIGLTSLKFTPADVVASVISNSRLLAETTRPGDAEWLVTSDTAVVWVESDGRLAGGSPEAGPWLTAFFEDGSGILPAALSDWLAEGIAGRPPFECRVGEQRLRITAFHANSNRLLLVLRRLEPAFNSNSLRRLGLSGAECALIPWLIRGKRNDEMAVILGLAPKTIEKQVASVLAKLGVETRTAAAWNIIERTGAHR